MHERAMLLLKREQSTNVYDYAPIARVLCRIYEVAEAKIRRKFDIAYLRYTYIVHLYIKVMSDQILEMCDKL